MEKAKSNNPNFIFERYEQLKKRYFRRQREETDEYIDPLPREQIIKMFTGMGCEIPVTPDQPFTPLRRHADE
jgi:hypothetical protein